MVGLRQERIPEILSRCSKHIEVWLITYGDKSSGSTQVDDFQSKWSAKGRGPGILVVASDPVG